MSLPKSEVIIKPDGMVILESMEKSTQCYKLEEIAQMTGKVMSREEKEHTPVYHDVQQRSV